VLGLALAETTTEVPTVRTNAAATANGSTIFSVEEVTEGHLAETLAFGLVRGTVIVTGLVLAATFCQVGGENVAVVTNAATTAYTCAVGAIVAVAEEWIARTDTLGVSRVPMTALFEIFES
jgi:hypothetical protein